MPVYDGTIDNIVGYVVARDVLALAWEQGLVVLEDILRPPHQVPESTRALDLLREMQRRRTQMALVIDDHGGLSGLVTTEDLIEELVGDIMSEDDVPEQFFTREPSGRFLFRAGLRSARSTETSTWTCQLAKIARRSPGCAWPSPRPSPGRRKADHRQRNSPRSGRGLTSPGPARTDPSRRTRRRC